MCAVFFVRSIHFCSLDSDISSGLRNNFSSKTELVGNFKWPNH